MRDNYSNFISNFSTVSNRKFINYFTWRFCQGIKLAHLPIIRVALIQQQQKQRQRQKKNGRVFQSLLMLPFLNISKLASLHTTKLALLPQR